MLTNQDNPQWQLMLKSASVVVLLTICISVVIWFLLSIVFPVVLAIAKGLLLFAFGVFSWVIIPALTLLCACFLFMLFKNRVQN